MNRCGSSEGGGTAREVEPDHCHFVGVNFLGAMEVDMWGRFSKIARKMREEVEGAAKMSVEGKMIGHVGIYRAQNIRRSAPAKGFIHRRGVSTQRHRDLRYCVLENRQGATQRRRVLRRCEPER